MLKRGGLPMKSEVFVFPIATLVLDEVGCAVVDWLNKNGGTFVTAYGMNHNGNMLLIVIYDPAPT
ncbi:MAG: hypothetical protein V4519_02770 [Patescibacteria group bacterium]